MGCDMKKTAYVFFKEADHKFWYLRLLDRKLTHCFTYEHQLLGGYDCFLKVENLYNCFDTQILFGTKKDLLSHHIGVRCIQITLDVDPLKTTHDFMPINCVSLTKKQIGINKPFIITPKQLLNHLLSIGGQEI